MQMLNFSYVIFSYEDRPWVYSKYPFNYKNISFSVEGGVGVLTYDLPMELNCRQQDLMGQPLFPYVRFDDGLSSFSFLLKAVHRFIWHEGKWRVDDHSLRFLYDSSISTYAPLFTSLISKLGVFDIPGCSSMKVPARIYTEQM